MTLGTTPGSALAAFGKRKEQIERWSRSDTAKESTEIKNRPKRINFADKCIFLAASSSGDKAQISRMLRDGYDINEVDEDGITALHQACIEDNIEMVEFLLEHGADVNISDNEGWTPLHAVASCNFTSIAKVLLEHGGNIIALNNDCCLPLDICKNEDIKNLFKTDLASKGIDVGAARKAEELTMIQDAKKWLVEGYSEIPHPATGATAMHVAACKGYIKVLDKLVKAGADVNACDFDGWTPLHAAAHWGQVEACRVLLEANCDPIVLNNCYQTALDLADPSVAPFLEQYRKKDDASKKRDARAGKLNVLPLPPKKKSLRMSNDIHLSTKKDGDLLNKGATTGTSSDENSNNEEEEFGGSEAEDTVGDLPSSSIEPIDINHGTSTNPMSNLIEPHLMNSRVSQNHGDENNAQDETTMTPMRQPTTRESKKTKMLSELFLKTRDRDVFSNTGFGDTPRARRLGEGEKVSSSLPSLSSTTGVALGTGIGSVPSTKTDYLKSDAGGSGDTEEGGAAWRRGGSLRTRTSANPAKESCEEDQTTASDKATVRRTRSEANPDVILRRAHSFESDAKFYSRLTVARERLKAIEAVSAAMNAQLGNDDTTKSKTSRLIENSTTTTAPASSTTNNEDSTLASRLSSRLPRKHNTSDDETTTEPATSLSIMYIQEERLCVVNDVPSRKLRTYSEDSVRIFNKTISSASNCNPDVVLRRKEAEPVRSPRPTTISTTNLPMTQKLPTNPGQLRSGEVESCSGSTTPSPPASVGKIGAVSKFKQFLIKSFVPPARDEESETQRKAHAKRVRETRRSTQGVTLEELKSAEQYVKAQQSNDTVTNEQAPECCLQSTTPVVTQAPTTVSSTLTTTNAVPLRKEDDSLERRPSWRLRVDDMDRSKFSLEDLRSTAPSSCPNQEVKVKSNTASTASDAPHSPSVRIRRHELKTTRPPRPDDEGENIGTEPANQDKEVKSEPAGVISKKKKPKRRSTGVVSYSNAWSDEPDAGPTQSETESSRRSSDIEGNNTGQDSPRNENGVITKVNYKKLYEETLKENQQLKSRVSGLEEELSRLKINLERATLSARIGADVADKREKRALELKFQEMEDELKLLQKLKLEGEKLKAENRALTRVVSKLSGGSSTASSANNNSNQKQRPEQQK